MIIFGVEVKGDHTFDRESMERYMVQAYKAGQEDERAKIVAWLRDCHSFREIRMALAHLIKAGEHLK
jgi:hypothetical protein